LATQDECPMKAFTCEDALLKCPNNFSSRRTMNGKFFFALDGKVVHFSPSTGDEWKWLCNVSIGSVLIGHKFLSQKTSKEEMFMSKLKSIFEHRRGKFEGVRSGLRVFGLFCRCAAVQKQKQPRLRLINCRGDQKAMKFDSLQAALAVQKLGNLINRASVKVARSSVRHGKSRGRISCIV
jgi:hypothetical protein